MTAPLSREKGIQLSECVQHALDEARRRGASAAEVSSSEEQGLSVTVRLGEVETVEHTRDRSLGVSVYFGQRTGAASTSDFSNAAVEDTVRAACAIARHTAEDSCNGLAEAQRMAREIPDLDLYHLWNPSVETCIELARECENSAREEDVRITNSEGATVSSHDGATCYGNSHGFLHTLWGSQHSLSCAVVGQTGQGMQRDYWYTCARDSSELESAHSVGVRAARRTLRRLDARRLTTRQAPVIFEAPVAASLFGHFLSAISGGALYRKASFLEDHLGRPVFSATTQIAEQPHLKKAAGSTPYDQEGVATRARQLVVDGELRGYLLGAYSARKLGMQTTGNAGGAHNLLVAPGTDSIDDLLRRMDHGLLVTELIGMGVNTVTGDYSRGAAGFWVEGGELAWPVEEITVAGNLKNMYQGLVAVANDVDTRGNIRTGSVLLENLAIAGG